MKKLAVFSMVVGVCFLLGLGMVVLSPTEAQAEDICCWTNYIYTCGPDPACRVEGKGTVWIWYQEDPFCEGAYSCGGQPVGSTCDCVLPPG